jgi:hypothetical protein
MCFRGVGVALVFGGPLAASENGLKWAFSRSYCGRFTVFMPPVRRPTVLLKYSPALLLKDVVELEQVVMAIWNALRVHALCSPLMRDLFGVSILTIPCLEMAKKMRARCPGINRVVVE